MAVIKQAWYNANESRRYPLDDGATGTDDAGDPIRDDVLVDLHLRWPSAGGQYAFLGGLTVTDTLVSLVILGSDAVDAASSFVPLAAISLPKPVDRYVHYPLEAIYPGAGGFVVFGDTSENVAHRFALPAQGLLLPKAARPYDALPIPSMRKLGRVDALTGLVLIRGENDVIVVKETVEIDGVEHEALAIRLRGQTGQDNPLSRYIGPCGGRPESLSCGFDPVESVNGITPDCNGDLRLEFRGMTDAPFDSCGSEAAGVTLDQDLDIEDVCLPRVIRRDDGEDYCAELLSSSSSAGTGPDDSEQPSSSEGVGEPLPFFDTFDPPHGSWQVKSGAINDIATGIELSDASRRQSYIWNDPGLESSLGNSVVTQVQLRNTGGNANGGLVLNWRRSSGQTRYLALHINRNTNKFELLRFTGSEFVTEEAVTPPYPFDYSDFYQLTANTFDTGTDVLIEAICRNVSNAAWGLASFSTTVSYARYGPSSGKHGIGNYRAVTRFAMWEVQNV